MKRKVFRNIHRDVFSDHGWNFFFIELHRRRKLESVKEYWAMDGIHNHMKRFEQEKDKIESILEGQRYLHEALLSLLVQEDFDAVVEIGCGNGLALQYYALKCPDTAFYGLDIEKATIDFCQNAYSESNLHFIFGTLQEKIAEFASKRVLIFSRATLYHFSENELHDFHHFMIHEAHFRSLRYLGEYPVDLFYASKISFTQPHASESRRSVTFTMNHNYLYSLRNSGFRFVTPWLWAPEGPKRPQHLFWCASDSEIPLKLQSAPPFVVYQIAIAQTAD